MVRLSSTMHDKFYTLLKELETSYILIINTSACEYNHRCIEQREVYLDANFTSYFLSIGNGKEKAYIYIYHTSGMIK
jgi:hypothetical protein